MHDALITPYMKISDVPVLFCFLDGRLELQSKCECADRRKEIKELWETIGRVEDRLECRIAADLHLGQFMVASP